MKVNNDDSSAGAVSAPNYGMPDGGAPYGSPVHDDAGGGLFAPRRLLSLALRKWYLIALAMVLGVSAAWFYLSQATPLYMADSLVEMSVRRPRITTQRGPVSDDTDFYAVGTEEVFNTRIQKFKGTRMRELVAAQLLAITNRPALSQEQIAEILMGGDFSLIRRSYLLRVTCVSADPEIACLGANAFAEGTVQLSVEENRIASDNAVVWLEQQAQQQQKALDKITQAITAFREAKRIDASENEKAALQKSLVDIGTQLTQLDNARVLADKLLAAVKAVSLDPRNAGNLPDSTPRREEIVQAVAKWLLAIQERDALMARFTPDHPDVIARSKNIFVLGEQVAGAIKRAQSTAEANLLLLDQQAVGLRQRMETQSRAAAELEGRIIRIQAEFGELERERNVADMSYKSLLTRIEEARLSADENTATVKIVERASTPASPFTPHNVRILLLSIFLGIVGGISLALLVEMLEDRFIGTDDLQRALGLPVLGLVPILKGKRRIEIGRVAEMDRFGHGAEAYAGIRAKIMASLPGRQGLCLLVTSAGPSEGKTITATNLAISYARTGVRTLLVDFDMRRPKVRSVFDLSDETLCLLDVLGRGDIGDFSRLPTPMSCPNLYVIGNHASKEYSAAEAMGSRIVKDFVAWARSSYDVVILDSPPFGVVSDALILAGLSDGVVFVSRPGVSRRHALRHAVEEFSEAGAPLLGVVVNAVNFDRMAFLSNYDYRYGCGYQSYTYPDKE